MNSIDDCRVLRCRRLKLLTCFILLFLSLWNGANARSKSGSQRSGENNCIECHKRADGRAGEVVGLHLKSAHARLGCQGCHGGDPNDYDEAKAHAGTFVGKPDTSATLKMCARCHESPLVQFKDSRHFPEHRGVPRVDCVTCHGAHTIGGPSETSSLAQVCIGCHGLEYLPALPKPVQVMLELADDLRDSLGKADREGRAISPELIDRRKGIRHRVSEIVHPTDLKGGLEKIPQILDDGRLLKQQIAGQK